MKDHVRDSLRDLLARHGPALATDAARCDALLRDLCPDDRREVTVLVLAVRSRVAGEIARSSDGGPLGTRLAALASRLEEESALTPDAARWAVESWAIALGRMPASIPSTSSPVGGAPASAEVSGTDAAAVLRQANEAYRQGDWASAVRNYEGLLRQVPGHPVALERLESCRPKLEEFARRQVEAREREAFLERERVQLPLYRETAETYLAEGRPGMALEWLARIRAVEPEDPLVVSQAGFIRSMFDIQMVTVPAGVFIRGSAAGEGGAIDEKPQRDVYVSDFAIDRYEVTNEAFAAALNWAIEHGEASLSGTNVVGPMGDAYLTMGDGGCRVSRSADRFVAERGYERHPVTAVTWYGAAAFCNWRSGMDELRPCYDTRSWSCDFTADGFRLPTEAEWEKAARGTDGRRHPWGNEAPDRELANFGGGGDETTPVGSCPCGQSPYGVEDMAGNVWEWCNDWYDGNYYDSAPGRDPRGPGSARWRISRGGSWCSDAHGLRVASRNEDAPDDSSHECGFRCARTITP